MRSVKSGTVSVYCPTATRDSLGLDFGLPPASMDMDSDGPDA